MTRSATVSGENWNKHQNRLRSLYILLCAFQLSVAVAGIAIAYRIDASYSRSLQYETNVSAARRTVDELVVLARAMNPVDSSADSSWDDRVSRVRYATGLFQERTRALIKSQTESEFATLATSNQELRDMLADAAQVSSETELAAKSAAAHEPAKFTEAQTSYADRAAFRVSTHLGNIGVELARAKDEALAAETEQARRSRMYLAPLCVLGLFLILPAAKYARSLDRQIARLQKEIQNDRALLEERVVQRTSELREEMEKRNRIEAFNHRRNKLLQMMVEGESLTEVIKALALVIDSFAQPARCVILASNLEPYDSPDDPDDSRQILQLRSAMAAQPEQLLTLGSDPRLLTFGDPAQSSGKLTVLASTIPIAHPEAGIMVLFSASEWQPTAFHEELLSTGTRMAAAAISHSKMQEELFRRAHHDALTGLPNRMLCEDRLSQAIARAARHQRKIAVLCLDVDEFKQVNDQYGHVAGDSVLQQVAVRILARLRASDTLARIGGDEFIAVVEDIKDSEDVEAVAANIVDAIAEPLIVDHNRMRCTASIGIALYPDDGTSMEELKRNADHAMYRAKQSGRNTYCAYSRTLSDTLARRRQIQNHLREALERDGFEMYYQPQYTPAGTLTGIEALVRFRDAELKHISPGEFIPIAEETGLMNEVGWQILSLVCKQMETWRTQGLGETVISVNISAIQLERSTFARDVSQLLKKYGIHPSSLQLEITETAMMSHVEECRRQLAEIEKLGVGLSLDDFGTGHSSLSYIHRLPVNTIKIDRSFVQRLPQSDESTAIIRAIIAMASALNLKVVAEGVETQAQLRAVEKLGCDGIQGYLFSKPLDTAGVTALLGTQAARYDETATQLHVI